MPPGPKILQWPAVTQDCTVLVGIQCAGVGQRGLGDVCSLEVGLIAALLHGSDCGRIEGTRSLNSSGADGLWTSKLKYAVQSIVNRAGIPGGSNS